MFLSLDGLVIPNYGYVITSNIGHTYESALRCHTNHVPGIESNYSEGDWFGPDGSYINGSDAVINLESGGLGGTAKLDGFYSIQALRAVGLIRTTGPLYQGIYHCSIADNTSTIRTLLCRDIR